MPSTNIRGHLSVSKIALPLILLLVPFYCQAVEDRVNDPFGARMARGLGSEAFRSDFDDIDAVNLFNGSLQLSIPIGASYPAGGDLSYQLVAYYNSNVEDVRLRFGPLPGNPWDPNPVEFAARMPNAGSTAGLGWSLHLGRLLSPAHHGEYNQLSAIERERRPKPGFVGEGTFFPSSGWRYLAPDDSVVDFYATLRDESAAAPDVFYTRDGRYLRLQLRSPGTNDTRLGACPSSNGTEQCAFLEFPNGDIHRFEKRPIWPDTLYNPDPWRLRAIRDRGNGSASFNSIDVHYFANRWEIQDRYGRVQRVHWEPDPVAGGAPGWYHGRVKRVELTAFGGAAAYDFHYGNATFPRINDQGTNIETWSVSVLQRIVRPDGLAYDMTQQGNPSASVPIGTIRLPNGGRVDWQYGSISFPTVTTCGGEGSPISGEPQRAVLARIVRDATGVALKDTHYLRGQYHGEGLPVSTFTTGYCTNDGVWTTPNAELVTGVFEAYEQGAARLTLHYHSIWPFPSYITDDAWNGTHWTERQARTWGWKGEDFGQPFTRNEHHAASKTFLSSRIYDCPFQQPPGPGQTHDPKAMAGTCTLRRSHYIQREGIREYPRSCAVRCTPYEIGDLGHDPIVAGLAQTYTAVTRFDDNQGKIARDDFIDNDGFGRYRWQYSSGNVGPDRTVFEYADHHEHRGTLELLPTGNPSPSSSWSNYPAHHAWTLDNLTVHRVGEYDASGNPRLIQQQHACYLANSTQLHRKRLRKNPNVESSVDLVQVYDYANTNPGLPVHSRFYGGDLTQLPAVSNGQGCGYAFEQSAPAFRLDHEYAHGVLLSSRVNGSTDFLINRRSRTGAIGIDLNSGLVTAERDGSGTLVTETTYDPMGRPTRKTRLGGPGFSRIDVGPDDEFTYYLPGYPAPPGWSGPLDRPIVIARSHKGATTLQRITSILDVLGRTVRTETLHPESGSLRVDMGYTPDGRIRFETTPQLTTSFNPSLGTSRTYDVFGRPLDVVKPDGHSIRYDYGGIRRVDVTTSIGVTENPQSVGTRRSKTTSIHDRYGNLLRVSEPVSTTAASPAIADCSQSHTICKVTHFGHDALGRRLSATRAGQTRMWGYDGRGLMTYERLPELGGGNAPCTSPGAGCRMLSRYNALGSPGFSSDGGTAVGFEYDNSGRLTRITDGSAPQPKPYASFVYGTSGVANGRLVSARRHNYVTRSNSGGAGEFPGGASLYGDRRVTFTHQYQFNGNPSLRQVQVHHVRPNGSEFLMAQFEQSWSSDFAGRLSRTVYPRCTNNCFDAGPVRAVDVQYGFGSRPLALSTADNLGATLGYHSNGQLRRITHHGPVGRTDWFGMGPNHLPRLASINLASASSTNPGTSGLLNLGNYAYDGADNITQIGTTRFVYDYNSRLGKSFVAGFWGASQSFAYDLQDNMTAATPDTFQFNPATNRLQAADMGYDASGQLDRVGAYRFSYDVFGQQESMVHESGTANPCILSNPTGSCWLYWYGPDGQRVGGIALLPSGQNGGYFWTLRDLDGRTLRRFEGINEGITATEDLVYAGGTLVGSKDLGSNTPLHHHSDHLGSIRLSRNAVNGQIAGERSFSPYGRPIADTLELDTHHWAGYERDPNGLTNSMGARQYFSTWGRFFTPDPARDGWNLYAYARNNPITFTDPTGMTTQRGNCVDRGQETGAAQFASNQKACSVGDNGKDGPVAQFHDWIDIVTPDPSGDVIDVIASGPTREAAIEDVLKWFSTTSLAQRSAIDIQREPAQLPRMRAATKLDFYFGALAESRKAMSAELVGDQDAAKDHLSALRALLRLYRVHAGRSDTHSPFPGQELPLPVKFMEWQSRQRNWLHQRMMQPKHRRK
ncbi:MAG TPA: RHS repeat-associated core domain-containing protein [Xanthomonadaceae bacterium]|nr:RHS repeat-associated core domain-containing protein [Xanthomonadaceae bacterium]